jgi:hypothetical protein
MATNNNENIPFPEKDDPTEEPATIIKEFLRSKEFQDIVDNATLSYLDSHGLLRLVKGISKQCVHETVKIDVDAAIADMVRKGKISVIR